jgi:adenosylcobinamide-GDP ribazoletransferase
MSSQVPSSTRTAEPATPPPATQQGVPFFRGVRAACIFLTRIPVGGFPYSRADWRWASAHFPLVGLMLGGMQAVIYYALYPLGALAAAMLTIGASMMLTGAFHEDGLADTSDALGGAFDREKLLEILKDSRVGAFGASALVFTIVTRATLLARLEPMGLFRTLGVLGFVFGLARVVPVWQMVLLPYATEQGRKSRDVTRAGVVQGLVATSYAMIAALLLVGVDYLSALRVLAMFAAVVIIGLITAYRYHVRLGGIAGDFLGATEQLCEIALLATLAWRHA